MQVSIVLLWFYCEGKGNHERLKCLKQLSILQSRSTPTLRLTQSNVGVQRLPKLLAPEDHNLE